MDDAYAFYVCAVGVPEDFFWHADITSVEGVAASKKAFDAWLGHAQAAELKKEARDSG